MLENNLWICEKFHRDLIKLGNFADKMEVGGMMFAKEVVKEEDHDEEEEDFSMELDSVVLGYRIDEKSFFLPKQEVTGGSISFDESSLAKFYERNRKRLRDDMLVWWHSHNVMNTEPSSQDYETLENLSRNTVSGKVCMLITNHNEDSCSYIGFCHDGFYMMSEISLVVDRGKDSDKYFYLNRNIEKKAEELIIKKETTPGTQLDYLGPNYCYWCGENLTLAGYSLSKNNNKICSKCWNEPGGIGDY